MNPCDVCFMCDDYETCLQYGECIIEAEEMDEWIEEEEDDD